MPHHLRREQARRLVPRRAAAAALSEGRGVERGDRVRHLVLE